MKTYTLKIGVKFFIFALVFAALHANSFAAGSNVDSLSFVEKIVTNAVGDQRLLHFKNAAFPIAGSLNSLALKIGGTLALLAMTWAVVEANVEKKAVINAVAEPLIFSSISALVLANYQTIVNDIFQLGIDTIGAAGSTVSNALSGYVQAMFTPVIETVKTILNVGVIAAVFNSFDLLFGALVSFVAALFALLALVELVKVLVIGPIAFGLGVSVGPLFVATLPFSATRRWFDQWLNFLINSAMLTAIAVIVVVLVSNVFNSVVSGVISGGGSTVGSALGLALFAWALSSVFQAVPGFADALFPGRTGVGSAKTPSYKPMGSSVSKGIKQAISMSRSGANGAKAAAQTVNVGSKLATPVATASGAVGLRSAG